jgi:hypothetical protein
MWAAHEVRFHRNGVKHFTHPAVGEFDLSFEVMELPGQEGLTLVASSAPLARRPRPAGQPHRRTTAVPLRVLSSDRSSPKPG